MNLYVSIESICIMDNNNPSNWITDLDPLVNGTISTDLNIILFSRRDNYKDIAKQLDSNSLANVYFINRSDSESFKTFMLQHPGKNILLGPKKEDMFKASNLKILFLCPMWANKIDALAQKYGTNIVSIDSLIKILKILSVRKNFYYQLDVDKKTTVYALTSANNYGATETESQLIDIFRNTLKQGNRQYFSAVLFYLLSSIMENPNLRGTNLWGIMPSSGTNFNQEMLEIKDHCRYLTGNRFKDPIFIRHTQTNKSHQTNKTQRLFIGAKKHLDTIEINPKYKQKIKGKTVCILDDYVTNGISFEALRNLLEAAGAKRIFFIAIGRFRSRDNKGLGSYQKENYSFSGDIFGPSNKAKLDDKWVDFGKNGFYDESAKASLVQLTKLL